MAGFLVFGKAMKDTANAQTWESNVLGLSGKTGSDDW